MQYDKTFKEEAIRLSDEIGLKNASVQLGVLYYTLSGWRNKRNKYGQNDFPGSGYKNKSGPKFGVKLKTTLSFWNSSFPYF